MSSLDIKFHDDLEPLSKQIDDLSFNVSVSRMNRIPMGSHGIYSEEKHYLELLIRVMRKKIDRDHC